MLFNMRILPVNAQPDPRRREFDLDTSFNEPNVSDTKNVCVPAHILPVSIQSGGLKIAPEDLPLAFLVAVHNSRASSQIVRPDNDCYSFARGTFVGGEKQSILRYSQH